MRIVLSTVYGSLVYLCARTSSLPSAKRRAKYFVYFPFLFLLRRAIYLVYLCACRVKIDSAKVRATNFIGSEKVKQALANAAAAEARINEVELEEEEDILEV